MNEIQKLDDLSKLDIEKPKALWRKTVNDYVTALAPSKDSKNLACVSASGELSVFDAFSGARLWQVIAHKFGSLDVSFSPNGTLIATCGQDGTFRVWHTESRKEIFSAKGGSAWVENILWSHDSKKLVISSGKFLKVYTSCGELIREFPKHESTITSLCWSSNGARLYSCCYGNVFAWDIESDTPKKNYQWKGSIIKMTTNPQDKFIACGVQDGGVHVWNLKNDKDLEMNGYPLKVKDLYWSPSGRFLATGGGVDITIWDFAGKGPAGSRPTILKGHVDAIADLAYEPSGTALASGGEDGALLFWQPEKTKVPLALTIQKEAVSKFVWSPNAQSIFCGYADGSVACWPRPRILNR